MDDKYYRDLIDKVLLNEKAMWGGTDEPNDGYEDFNKLWGLLFDEEATLSPQTYFEAMELFFNSFFGTIQDHSYVWRDISKRYIESLNNNDTCDTFIVEFKKFLDQNKTIAPDLPASYDLIHVAIDSRDLDMVKMIFDHAPVWSESWDGLKDLYVNHPEMAAYYETLTDISYDYLPDSPIFKETIKKLYSAFGNLPNMEKLDNLYHKYY